MFRRSFARAVLIGLVGLFLWTTISPADARPRRYAGEILADWTICRNGADLEIAAHGDPMAPNTRLRLVVTTTGSPAQQLSNQTHTVGVRPLVTWAVWDLPTGGTVVDDVPDPTEMPDTAPDTYRFSRVVNLRWKWRAMSNVRIALGPVDATAPRPVATYRVKKCRFEG